MTLHLLCFPPPFCLAQYLQWILPFTLFPNLEEMSGSTCFSQEIQDRVRLVRVCCAHSVQWSVTPEAAFPGVELLPTCTSLLVVPVDAADSTGDAWVARDPVRHCAPTAVL